MAPALSIGAVDDDRAPTLTSSQYPIASNPFQALARNTMNDGPPIQRVYSENSTTTAFSGLERKSEDASEGRGRPPQQAARRDIHAIKVVTRLIQGIAFNPGGKAPNGVKSAVLRDQIVEVHRLAGEIAQAAMPEESHRPWVLAQCSEVVADMMARRSEREGDASLDVEQQVRAINHVLRSSDTDDELARAIAALSPNRYVEAVDPAVARDRLHVSMAAATWDLHEKVSDSAFLYGMSAIEMVDALTQGLVKAAAESNIQISNLDMQTSHLQGSIRRLAGLVGAEYVSRTKTIMQWIKGPDAKERMDSAIKEFPGTVLPEILATARRNFYSIEKIAPKLIEDAFQEQGSRVPRDHPNGV